MATIGDSQNKSTYEFIRLCLWDLLISLAPDSLDLLISKKVLKFPKELEITLFPGPNWEVIKYDWSNIYWSQNILMNRMRDFLYRMIKNVIFITFVVVSIFIKTYEELKKYIK